MDLVFLLDMSGSIRSDRFQVILGYLVNLTATMEVRRAEVLLPWKRVSVAGAGSLRACGPGTMETGDRHHGGEWG